MINQLKVMAGVAAHNEEKNIDNLLPVLINDDVIDAIVVVSSSTDRTNEIVRDFAQRNKSKLKLVEEVERRGKSLAFNTMIEIAQNEKFDILLYTGGDTLPDDGAIETLLKEFNKSNVGVVGGRPEPIDSSSNFLGWSTILQWNMLHNISIKFKPKICGDLMAMRTDIIKELPIAVINDDAYIQLMAEAKGYKLAYCPAAIVRFRGCSSIKDLIKQRKRIYLGYMQLLFLTGIKLPTFKWRYYHKVIRDSLPSFGLKEFFYLIGSVTIQFWAWLLALKDFYLFRTPYKWELAETTKERIDIQK
jgi:cellulose synthase/poly-beta-1,6-N-acetylglucosamine synthase-like glycosyltransferase